MWKSFKFMVLRLLENTFVIQKIDPVHFYSCPKQNSPPCFYHYSPGRRKLPIPPKQCFLKIYISPAERGEDYRVEKITKINPIWVLVTS